MTLKVKYFFKEKKEDKMINMSHNSQKLRNLSCFQLLEDGQNHKGKGKRHQ